jgi:hypothetical protein
VGAAAARATGAAADVVGAAVDAAGGADVARSADVTWGAAGLSAEGTAGDAGALSASHSAGAAPESK